MKLLDALLLYPSFALLIIGLHQIITRSLAENSFAKGFAQSYWIVMLALILLYVYQLRRNKRQTEQTHNAKPTPKPNATKRKK